MAISLSLWLSREMTSCSESLALPQFLFHPLILFRFSLSGVPLDADASVTSLVNTDVQLCSRGCLFEVSVVLPSGATFALEGNRNTDTVGSLASKLGISELRFRGGGCSPSTPLDVRDVHLDEDGAASDLADDTAQAQQLAAHSAAPAKGATTAVAFEAHDGCAAPAVTTAWTIDAWLASLDLHQAAATALAPPLGQDAFSYAKTRLAGEVECKLKAAKLEGLLPCIMEGIAALKTQEVATASELNQKFAVDGSGSIELT